MSGESMIEYIARARMAYRKVRAQNVELSEVLQAFLLLRRASLT